MEKWRTLTFTITMMYWFNMFVWVFFYFCCIMPLLIEIKEHRKCLLPIFSNKIGYVITRKKVSKKRSSFSGIKLLPFFDREPDGNNRKHSARIRKMWLRCAGRR